MTARRWTTAPPTALVVAVLLAACGVPHDEQPRALQPGEAPYASARASPVAEPEGARRVPLHFVRQGAVVLAPRPVEGATTTEDVLELLFGGPTPEEREAGLLSVIPSTVRIEDVELTGRTAVITLGGPESEVLRLQPLAYAQIVATLTPSLVTGVRFRLEGTDLPVPRGDNTLSAAPLSRDDYASLLGPPAPATTPSGSAAPSA